MAFVTGAASGIGEATAETLARAKAFVYVADIDEEKGREAARAISQVGQGGFLKLDVSDERQCIDSAQTVYNQHGRLDILVNNAGVGAFGTILQSTGVGADLVDTKAIQSGQAEKVTQAAQAYIAAVQQARAGGYQMNCVIGIFLSFLQAQLASVNAVYTVHLIFSIFGRSKVAPSCRS